MSKRHRQPEAHKPQPVEQPAAITIGKGVIVGRWKVIRESTRMRSGHWYAVCQCVCGTQQFVYVNSLRAGTSTGCKSNACRAAHEARV